MCHFRLEIAYISLLCMYTWVCLIQSEPNYMVNNPKVKMVGPTSPTEMSISPHIIAEAGTTSLPQILTISNQTFIIYPGVLSFNQCIYNHVLSLHHLAIQLMLRAVFLLSVQYLCISMYLCF